jgi:hypothetical protein
VAEAGDAPAPGEVAAVADTGGDGEVVSFEDALAGAIAETGAEDVTEGEVADVEAAPESEEPEDGDKTPVERPPKPKKEEKKDEPPAEEAKVSEKNRREFAAIAKERGKLREREAAIVQREEQAKALEPRAKAFDDVRRRIHEDPAGLIREAGGEELVNKLLDQLGSQTLSPAEQEVAKLRRELDADKARLKAQQEQQLVANWRRDIQAEVEKAGEQFDLVNSLGEHDAVVECMTEYFAKYKVNLPIAVAAQAIEEGLAAKLAKSKKFGAREAAKLTQASTGTPPPKKKSNTTLSSVAAGDVPQGDDDGPMSEQDRFKWAMGLAAV